MQLFLSRILYHEQGKADLTSRTREKRMSLTLQRLIWQVSPDVLNSTETLVLLRLADFAQEDGSSIYPSLKRVSQDTKLTERGIQKALVALLKKGILLLVKPFTSRTPNVYRINVDYLKSLHGNRQLLGETYPSQGRMTFIPRDELDSPLTIEKTGRGEPCSPQGRTTFTSRDERRSPNPLYKPLIEPLILLPVSADGHDGGEGQKKEVRKKHLVDRRQQDESLLLDQFNQWYEGYPRKVSRKKALAAFPQALKQLSFDKLLVLTRTYAQEVENRDQQYIPYPATWLRGERWEEVKGIPRQEEESITLPPQAQQKPAIDGRLQGFLDRYVHQVCNNAFAFKECQLQEEEDRIILQASSPFYRDRVELFEQELKKHFGKQVLITLSDPKPPMRDQSLTSPLAEGFVEPQLQAFLANNPRIDASVYFAFKSTELQETETTVTLFNLSAFCLSKLDFYLIELERFFGKRVSLVCGEKPLRVKPKLEVLESSPKATQKKVSRVSTTSSSYGGHNLKKVAAA